MIRGHAIYEGVYLLGTSIARPLIAKDQIRIAKKYNAINQIASYVANADILHAALSHTCKLSFIFFPCTRTLHLFYGNIILYHS